MRPSEGGVDEGPGGRAELVRAATGVACVQLWARVVLQVLADIDVGLRVLRTGPAAGPEAAEARSARMADARSAAAWLFGAAARRDRAWICSWLDLEPRRLQEAVRRAHGAALDGLLAEC